MAQVTRRTFLRGAAATAGAAALRREFPRADLVVLSADPTAIDAAGLADVEVLMTMVAGEAVFCAPGEHALCRSA
jgi:hypothetical protein